MSDRTVRHVPAKLAELAREFAAQAPPTSLERRAYGCAAVALSTTRTVDAARRALAGVTPAEVRAAALEAVAELERRPT